MFIERIRKENEEMKKAAALIISGICMVALSACATTNPAENNPAGVSEAPSQEAQVGDAGVIADETEGEPYYFEVNGVKFTADTKSQVFLDACKEAKHYYEAKSCAFEGMDKVYTYDSYEITTYPKGDSDYIASIVLKDDTVTTAEGIYISSPKEKVLSTYGENYTEKNGAFVYSSGGMELRFIFDSNDACISIEYASTVLNE